MKVLKIGGCLQCEISDNGIGYKQSLQSETSSGQKRTSFGGSLAEKLITAIGDGDRRSEIKYAEVLNASGETCGTLVSFVLPFISDTQ